MFVQGDVDKDGYLNYGEFVAISVHLRKMGSDDHLKEAFEFFDKNKSGYIEEEELREALVDEIETDNEDIIAAIILDVDTDKVCICSIFLFLFVQHIFVCFYSFNLIIVYGFRMGELAMRNLKQ